MLETASHQVLRTGEESGFSFSFDCGWVINDRAYAIPQADFNPLITTRRFFPTRNNETGTAGEMRYTRYNPYNKPSNWMPGPSLGYLGSTQTSQNPQYARGPITVVTQPPGTEAEESTRDEQSRTHVPSENTMHYSGYDVNPVNCGSSRLDGHSLAYDSAPESRNQPIITVRGIDLDMPDGHLLWCKMEQKQK